MWQVPNLRADQILVYLRKSRTDDPLLTVGEVLSKHEQMLDEWVSRNLPDAGRVPEANRFREIMSGETLDSRPEVLRMLRLAESPRYRALLIVEPQRLTRGDLEDIGRAVKLLRYSDTIVITLQYIYDLRDERDRDAFERELKRGNDFLEYQKRIMSNGRLLAVENGNYLGTRPPYGYTKTTYKQGRKTVHTLRPAPREAEIVRLCFEWYAQGIGTTTIADRLNEMHAPTQSGGIWMTDTIARLLANEHYRGKVTWNRRRTVKHVEDGEVVAARPVADQYLVFDGLHPAIVSEELWQAVQARRGLIPRTRKDLAPFSPLAGLLYCARCGTAMVARRFTSGGVERCRPRVLCPRAKLCGCGSAALDDVLAEIVDMLARSVEDFEVELSRDDGAAKDLRVQMIAQLQTRLAELQELEVRQWDARTKGGMPAHVFEQLNGQTVAEIDDVKKTLRDLIEAEPVEIDQEARLSSFREALAALQDPVAPADAKNRLLKCCIERIEYERDKPSKDGHAKSGQELPFSLSVRLKI